MKEIIKIFTQVIQGIIAILEGMFTIAKHAFRKPVTLEYPEKKDSFNARLRGRVALRTKEDGSHYCIGCKSCVRACPCGDLIQIGTEKGEDKKLQVKKFTVDTGRCIVCGNCADVCPTKAIIMCPEYENSDYSREALVLDIEKLKLSYDESQSLMAELEKD